MPYLVGVPAANSFAALQHTPLDEVMLVDLDQGTCTPGSSLPPATPSSLPYAEELAAHLQVVEGGAHYIQGFWASCFSALTLKLAGNWRTSACAALHI